MRSVRSARSGGKMKRSCTNMINGADPAPPRHAPPRLAAQGMKNAGCAAARLRWPRALPARWLRPAVAWPAWPPDVRTSLSNS